MKHVTIKDVARALSVAVSTVSRAFNDKYDIKQETRDLILKKAKEMGYHPNPIAKKLTQQRTYNIGIIVPEFINEFYAEVIVGIQEVLIGKGYQVLIMQSDERCDLELENVKTLINNMVDGIIIAPTGKTDNLSYYAEYHENGYPMVLFSRIDPKLSFPKVTFDNYKWMIFLTEHLIKEGFKKIYYLSGNKDFSISRQRIRGFRKVMEKWRITYYKIIETGLLTEDGMQITEELISENDLPDAFVCFNDPVALGVMRTLKNHKVKVPDQVGVVGFTETKMAELIDPPLTSVKQPTSEMGRNIAELLLRQLENTIDQCESIEMDGKLNIRASSIRPASEF